MYKGHISLNEVFLEEDYSRKDLHSMCDHIIDNGNVLFGSNNVGMGIRAEPSQHNKEEWTIKQWFSTEDRK
jgi:hypothetical protein